MVVKALVAALVLAACGGGGGGGGGGEPTPVPTPPPVVTPPTSNTVALTSEPGDFIGQGRNYSYSSSDSGITVDAGSVPGRLSIRVLGNERWTADFVAPAGTTQFRVGRYEGLSTLPAVDPAKGAFRWFVTGRGCAASDAWVAIDQVAYVGNELQSISLRFARYCDGAAAALRGEFKWTRSDTTQQPAVPAAVPAGLWRPPGSALPPSGNYVYLESEAGDRVGQGRTYRYTPVDTQILASDGPNGETRVLVSGRELWTGLFARPDDTARLAEGYYPSVRRTPWHHPFRGGLNWSGEGRSCVALDGWMLVERVVYSQTLQLTALDLRFEQRCEGSPAVLRGAVRWTDPRSLPLPVPPALSAPGSWSAADTDVPASGNYLFLRGSRPDYMGGRQVYLATPLTDLMTVQEQDGLLAVETNGEQHWFGRVRAALGPGPLQVGLYPGLARLLVDDRPGQSWTTTSSCTIADSWLAIDEAQYAAGRLSSLRLRFDARCEVTGEVLQGQLRWSDADTRPPAGPQPVPPGLWRAPADAVPASGNYIVLDADPYVSITSDQQTRYTQANAVMSLAADGAGLRVVLRGEEHRDGQFQPMAGLTRLQPGYYPGLLQSPFHNPAKGGLSWVGDTHGCSQPIAAFVVDSVSYVGDQLDAIDLRFEQNCIEAFVTVVRGQIHWRSDDPTVPPGPVTPAPAALWRPPSGSTPANGNYLYLQSQPGDPIGNGQTTLVTPQQQPFALSVRDNGVDIEVGTAINGWYGHLEPMSRLGRLQPGYYGRLKGYPAWHNPARGGISWSGLGLGCNQSYGWFVVDSVSYEGDTLTALQARFAHYCDESQAPLNGEIRWQRP